MAPPEGTPSAVIEDPLAGTTLADRYQVVRKIGEGGMGAVYEARHTVLGKRVAVKVLLEKFLEKPDLVARLLQEARLASSIGHENIVDVTDFGTTADGRAFVVMEFLEGEPLAHLVMRDAPLPVERSIRIARQVASALGAAHAKGIVHRDVKPENAYLVRRGDLDFVKVVDFGVSKAVHSREEGAEWQRLTRTGMVLGTPLYMSPEQARGGDDVDSRADIWAVGVMLYECLTGEVPFRANNYLGVISQVLTQEAVPPSTLRPELGIPPAVEAVVMRALEKDRNRRYQAMGDLEQDLERLLAGDQNVGARETTPLSLVASGSTRHRWYLSMAAVLVIAAGIALALARTDEERRFAADRAGAASVKSRTATVEAARGPTAASSQPSGPPSSPVPATSAPPPRASALKAAPSPVASGAKPAAAADRSLRRPAKSKLTREAVGLESAEAKSTPDVIQTKTDVMASPSFRVEKRQADKGQPPAPAP